MTSSLQSFVNRLIFTRKDNVLPKNCLDIDVWDAIVAGSNEACLKVESTLVFFVGAVKEEEDANEASGQRARMDMVPLEWKDVLKDC